MILFWPLSENGVAADAGQGGARAAPCRPGPHMNRYGGNTSCVQVTPASGDVLILDAGTGIRTLAYLQRGRRIHILLTHLHLDHIQGLMFFPILLSRRFGDHDLGPGGARRRRSRTGSRATSPRRCRRSRCASCHARSRSGTRR